MSIVTINVNELTPPAPSTLQQSGAFISQGATTIPTGTTELITSVSQLSGLLKTASANSTLAWAGSVVTVTTAADHGFTNSAKLWITIAGVTPAAYNGTYLCTVTGSDTFTYALVSDPGSETVPGTYILADVAQLLAMGTTFFAQGAKQSVYVLELGVPSSSVSPAAGGVASLTTWIGANPGKIYSYLVPRYWDADAAFLTFLANYESTTSKTYFFVTTTTGTYTDYTSAMKDVCWLVEAPSIPATEFSLAAQFWQWLQTAPSATNRVPPFSNRYNYGVTAYPVAGNQSTIAAILAANGNIVGTGYEGGISNTLFQGGTFSDGNPMGYWYSVDWVQINIDLNISNAVINGSNNPQNPLYYNQAGINALQQVAASTLGQAVQYGLALGTVVQTQLTQSAFNTNFDNGAYAGQTVINAVPFIPWLTANPSDYETGVYGGFGIVYTPLRGFTSIVFNITVDNFVTGS